MSVVTQTRIPVGTYRSDPTHSHVEFAIRHMGVAWYRGSFEQFDATLEVAEGAASLTGVARVESVRVQDERLQGHLLSPEFFDVERTPEVRFTSTSFRQDGDVVEAAGELEVKGIRRPVTLRGEVTGQADDPYGNTRVGLELKATVDRSQFDLNWNAPLPGGGFVLGNDTRLTAVVELIRQAE